MSEADQTGPAEQRARYERDRQLDDVLEVIAQQARTRNVSRAETVAAVLQDFPEVSPEQLESATQAAHKLAGSAGTFGMDQASRLARGLERFLSAHAVDGDGSTSAAEDLARARTEIGELQQLLAPR